MDFGHKMDLGQECTLNFIEDYRQKPELWQTSNTSYRNKRRRMEALEELAEKYSTDPKNLLKKIKSLRTYFHKEHAKVIHVRNELGSDDDNVYQSSWFAYTSLLFILESDTDEYRYAYRPRFKRERDTTQYEDVVVEHTEDADEQTEELAEVNYADDCSYAEASEPPYSVRESSPTEIAQPPKKLQKTDKVEVEEYKLVNEKKRQMDNTDEFSIFGEYIACKLRKLKNERTQLFAQNRITNFLFELEMKNCYKSSST